MYCFHTLSLPQPPTTRQLCHPLSARPEDLLLIKPANHRAGERGRERMGEGVKEKESSSLSRKCFTAVLYGNGVSHIFIVEATAKDSNS